MSNRARLEALLALINSSAGQAMALYEQVNGTVPSIDSTELHPLDEALDQVELKAAICTLEGACAQLCTTLAPPGHTAINLVQVYDYSCVCLAVRENITNILMDYPKGLHVNELSKKINVEPKKLSRIMRLLATRGCYSEVAKDVFTNTRLSLVLHSENPVRHMANLHTESASKGGNKEVSLGHSWAG